MGIPELNYAMLLREYNVQLEIAKEKLAYARNKDEQIKCKKEIHRINKKIAKLMSSREW